MLVNPTIGDDIGPIEVAREDVGMMERKNPSEAEVPNVRLSPRIPPVARHKNMKSVGILSTEVGVLVASTVVESVDNIELNCWMKRREER